MDFRASLNDEGGGIDQRSGGQTPVPVPTSFTPLTAVASKPSNPPPTNNVAYIPAAALKRFADALENDSSQNRFLQVNRDRVQTFINKQPSRPDGNSRAGPVAAGLPTESHKSPSRKLKIPGIHEYSDATSTSSTSTSTASFVHLQQLPEFQNSLGPRSRFGEGDGSFFDRWLNADAIASKQAFDKDGLPVMNFSLNEVHSGFKRHLEEFKVTQRGSNGPAANPFIRPYAERRRLRLEKEQLESAEAAAKANAQALSEAEAKSSDMNDPTKKNDVEAFVPMTLGAISETSFATSSSSTMSPGRAGGTKGGRGPSSPALRALTEEETENYFGDEARQSFFAYYQYLSRRRKHEDLNIAHPLETLVHQSPQKDGANQSDDELGDQGSVFSVSTAPGSKAKGRSSPQLSQASVTKPSKSPPDKSNSNNKDTNYSKDAGVEDTYDDDELSAFTGQLDSPRTLHLPSSPNHPHPHLQEPSSIKLRGSARVSTALLQAQQRQVVQRNQERQALLARHSDNSQPGSNLKKEQDGFDTKKLKFTNAAKIHDEGEDTGALNGGEGRRRPKFAPKATELQAMKQQQQFAAIYDQEKVSAAVTNAQSNIGSNSPRGRQAAQSPRAPSAPASKAQQGGTPRGVNVTIEEKPRPTTKKKAVQISTNANTSTNASTPSALAQNASVPQGVYEEEHDVDDSVIELVARTQRLTYSRLRRRNQVRSDDEHDNNSQQDRSEEGSAPGSVRRGLDDLLQLHREDSNSNISHLSPSVNSSMQSNQQQRPLSARTKFLKACVYYNLRPQPSLIVRRALPTDSSATHASSKEGENEEEAEGADEDEEDIHEAVDEGMLNISPLRTHSKRDKNHEKSDKATKSGKRTKSAKKKSNAEANVYSKWGDKVVLRDRFARACLVQVNHLGIGDDHLIMLAESLPQLPALEGLLLRNNALTDQSLVPLLNQLLACKHVQLLDLSQNRLGRAGVRALLLYLASPFCHLLELHLEHLHLDDRALGAFVEVLCGAHGVGANGGADLQLPAHLLAALQTNGTTNNAAANKKALASTSAPPLVAASSARHPLTVLNLANNDFGSHELLASTSLSTTSSTASNAPSYASTAEVLARQLLSGHRFAGDSLYHLLTHPLVGNLTYLNLAWNSIGSRRISGYLLTEALKQNRSLTYLDLSHTGLGHDETALRLGVALHVATSLPLRTLKLAQNALDATAIFVLLSGIKRWGSELREVDVSENPIGMEGARGILMLNIAYGHRVTVTMQQCSVYTSSNTSAAPSTTNASTTTGTTTNTSNNANAANASAENKNKNANGNGGANASGGANGIGATSGVSAYTGHWFTEEKQQQLAGDYVLDLTRPYDYAVACEMLRIVAHYHRDGFASNAGLAFSRFRYEENYNSNAPPSANPGVDVSLALYTQSVKHSKHQCHTSQHNIDMANTSHTPFASRPASSTSMTAVTPSKGSRSNQHSANANANNGDTSTTQHKQALYELEDTAYLDTIRSSYRDLATGLLEQFSSAEDNTSLGRDDVARLLTSLGLGVSRPNTTTTRPQTTTHPRAGSPFGMSSTTMNNANNGGNANNTNGINGGIWELVDELMALYDTDNSGLIEEEELVAFLLDWRQHQLRSQQRTTVTRYFTTTAELTTFAANNSNNNKDNTNTAFQAHPPPYRPPEKGRLHITIEGTRPVALWLANAVGNPNAPANTSSLFSSGLTGNFDRANNNATVGNASNSLLTKPGTSSSASRAVSAGGGGGGSAGGNGQMQHQNAPNVLSMQQIHSLLETSKGLLQEREVLLEQALATTQWTFPQVKRILPMLVKEIGSVLRVLLQLLPHMLTPHDTRLLLQYITQQDFDQMQHMRYLLGPLFKIYIGIPDGYYALHLHEATDREAFFRLFSLNRDYMFQRRHVERQGDISQTGNWHACFRNAFLDDTPLQITEQWLATQGLPDRGLLTFDFVSIVGDYMKMKPHSSTNANATTNPSTISGTSNTSNANTNTMNHGTHATGSGMNSSYMNTSGGRGTVISNLRLFRMLHALEMVAETRRPRIMQKLSVNSEDGRVSAKGQGTKRLEILPYAARELGECLEQLHAIANHCAPPVSLITAANTTSAGIAQLLTVAEQTTAALTAPSVPTATTVATPRRTSVAANNNPSSNSTSTAINNAINTAVNNANNATGVTTAAATYTAIARKLRPYSLEDESQHANTSITSAAYHNNNSNSNNGGNANNVSPIGKQQPSQFPQIISQQNTQVHGNNVGPSSPTDGSLPLMASSLQQMNNMRKHRSALFRMPSSRNMNGGSFLHTNTNTNATAKTNSSTVGAANSTSDAAGARGGAKNEAFRVLEGGMYGAHLQGLVDDITLDPAFVAARYLDALEIILAGRFITCAQMGLLLEKFPCGDARIDAFATYRVELIISLFSRIVDKVNFEYVLRELTNAEMAMVIYRVGWLAVWNPLKAEGNLVLNLARHEERLLAKLLVVLNYVETGETWVEPSFRETRESEPITPWTLPTEWYAEMSLPTQGLLSLQYFSGKGMELQDCKPDIECRMRSMCMVLAEPYAEDLEPYSMQITLSEFESYVERLGMTLTFNNNPVVPAPPPAKQPGEKKSPRRP